MAQNRVFGYRAQTRSMMIRYTVVFGAVLLLGAILQVSLFGRLRFFGAVPDLMLCMVLAFAVLCGRYAGAITGIGAGFLIEAIGSTGISLLPVFYLLCGYVAGSFSSGETRGRSYPMYLLWLLCGLCLRAGMTVTYAALTYRYIRLPEILLYEVLPEAGITAIAGLVCYFPVCAVCRRLKKRKGQI